MTARLTRSKALTRLSFRDAKSSMIPAANGQHYNVFEVCHVVLDAAPVTDIHAQQYEGSRSVQGRTRLLGRMERTGQRHALTRRSTLAEEETIIQFETFLCETGFTPEDRAKCFKQFGKVSISSSAVREPEVVVEEVGPMMAEDIVSEDEPLLEPIPETPRTDKRMKGASSRNPKEVRVAYVPGSGRNAIRLLMVPGLDCFRFQFMGKLMPSSSQFDRVCKLCAKKGTVRVHESSGADTSSSTTQNCT